MVRSRFPDSPPGDVVVTNDPFAGGSHLPDVTVVTPVFAGGSARRLLRREPRPSRRHRRHEPGLDAADSRTLEEEGVLIEPLRAVRAGRFDEARVRALLAGARYPARRPDDNLAELEAMIAANRAGARLLEAGSAEQGRRADRRDDAPAPAAAAGKGAARDRAPARRRAPLRGPHGRRHAGCGAARASRASAWRSTSPAPAPRCAGNLNAPRAVVQAAVIYVLRSLVAERIPLNGGCLEPVAIAIPPGSLLDPPRGSAVVGGNVETSQRIVDVLLGAIGRAAASQGTMNNVTFGDATFGYYETIGGGAGAGAGLRRRVGRAHAHDQHAHHRSRGPRGALSRCGWSRSRCGAARAARGASAAATGSCARYRFLAPLTRRCSPSGARPRRTGSPAESPARAGATRSSAATAASKSCRRTR